MEARETNTKENEKMKDYLEFRKYDEQDMRAFATIIAQLTREGVTFTTCSDDTHIGFKLTGGY